MTVLICVENNDARAVLIEQLVKMDIMPILCNSFYDFSKYEDKKPTLFFCDESAIKSFNDYFDINNDKTKNVPYTIFLSDKQSKLCETLSISKILRGDFNVCDFLNYDRKYSLSKVDDFLIRTVFAQFGLSFRHAGTKLLYEVVKIIYNCFDHMKRLESVYEIMNEKTGKTPNAIKKAAKRAIQFACKRKCVGMSEMYEYFNIKTPTVKQLLIFMFTKFDDACILYHKDIINLTKQIKQSEAG